MKTLKIRIVNNNNINFLDKVEAIKKELVQRYEIIDYLKLANEVIFVCK